MSNHCIIIVSKLDKSFVKRGMIMKKTQYERLEAQRRKLERIEKELDKMGYCELSYQVMHKEKEISDRICEYLLGFSSID